MTGKKTLQGIPIEGAPNGVYILRTDNRLYLRTEWDAAWNTEAVGVAVVTDNCKFVIAPIRGSSMVWNNDYSLVSEVTNTTYESIAKKDYKGVQNSAAIVSKYGNSTDYAAGWCQNYTFKNGKKGYLGSCGEWQEAYNNKSEINACIYIIDGDSIAVTDGRNWTSTQYGANYAWCLDWFDGSTSGWSKNFKYLVRSFAQL